MVKEDFQRKTIGTVCVIVNGGTPKTTEPSYWDGGIDWVTPTDITNTSDKYLRTTARTISKEGLDNSSATMLPSGSLLLCSRATIGELAIAAHPMCTNQGFKNLIVKREYDSEFVYYALQPLKKEMISKAYGTTFLEISKAALSDIELLIPKKRDEQTAIAHALSDIDTLITYLEKLIEKKKAIYQCGIERCFDSASCEMIKLGQLASLVTKQTGFDYTATIQPALVSSKNSNTYPYIQTKFFCDRDFCFETDYYIPKKIADNFPKLLLNGKSLLISIVGSLGNFGIYDYDNISFLGGAICIAKFKKNIDVDFVYYFLKSRMGLKQIDNCTKGAVQPTLTIEDIRNFDIPDFKEQQKVSIVNALRDFEFDITKTNEKLNAFRMIKQGMMEQLLTGKIRLVESEDATSNKIKLHEKSGSNKPTGHNQQFDDAVVIAGIVNAFYSQKYPLGRKKVQKLLYLMRRKQEADTSAFKKKAAGPYADEIRYKGGEPIANKNGYITTVKSNRGTAFKTGKNIQTALSYIDKWQIQSYIDWLLNNFKFTKTDDLELFATVDMAMCELMDEGKDITVDSIKSLINSNSEWKAKLSKPYFSDKNIERAIIECKSLMLYT